MMPPDPMRALQLYLRDTGRSPGEIDGVYGPRTKEAVMYAFEDGPDTALTMQDYKNAGARLGCRPAYILAFAEVEAAGAGFQDGEPKILFEPHRFSRATKHRFDQTNPNVSYQKWGDKPYPKTQGARYAQLLEAVGLDPWAAFASASYGKFQILGENHQACGFDTPWAFAFSQAYDEAAQLAAFEKFIRVSGILAPLKVGLWGTVAEMYNGSAYRKNAYDVKLATAAHSWESRLVA